jgi:hypothetical protein
MDDCYNLMLSTNIDLTHLTFDILQLNISRPTVDSATGKIKWPWAPVYAHNTFGGLLAVRPCYGMESRKSGAVSILFECGSLANKRGKSLLGAGNASAQSTDIGGEAVETDISSTGALVPWSSTSISFVSFMLGEDTTDSRGVRLQKAREAGTGVVCLVHAQWTGPAGNSQGEYRWW